MTADLSHPALFEAFLATKRRRLIGLATRIVGQAWAEDVVQDALLRAWHALPRFEGGEREMGAWLRAVTANSARDRVRREAARPQTCALEWALDHPDGGTPEAALLRQEEAGAASARAACLLVPLSRRSQRVLWQMGALEQSAAEVARQWGQSPMAIKYVWLRAAKRCRQAAQGADAGGG